MSLPVEIMLARWPMLYPESIGDWKEERRDDEQGEDHGVQAARVRSEIIAPVLEAEDLVHDLRREERGLQELDSLPIRNRGRPGVGDFPRRTQGRRHRYRFG